MEPAKVVPFEKSDAAAVTRAWGLSFLMANLSFLPAPESFISSIQCPASVCECFQGTRTRLLVWLSSAPTLSGRSTKVGRSWCGTCRLPRNYFKLLGTTWRFGLSLRIRLCSDAEFESDSTDPSYSADVAYIDCTHFLFREGRGSLIVFEHLDGNICFPTLSKVRSWDRNLCMGVGAGKIVTAARRKGLGAFVRYVESGKISKVLVSCGGRLLRTLIMAS